MAADWSLSQPPEYFLQALFDLHARIRTRLRHEMERSSIEQLAQHRDASEGDTMFAIDVHADEILHEFFAEWSRDLPVMLIAEGLPGDGSKVFPDRADRAAVQVACIVDPIDGTRGLMYGKRSAWVLSGIAPVGNGALPRLSDICLAVQTELPTARSYLSDALWAVRGDGVHGETRNLESGEVVRSFQPQPSSANDLLYGFATLAKFFPGGKPLAAQLEEDLFEALYGRPGDGNPRVFDDQYICTGGQLYELMMG
ncbi:MAG: inositol monophosphatase, partial [Chloroflexota bacterium]